MLINLNPSKMKNLIILVLLFIIVMMSDRSDNFATKKLEEGYFEGQKDALTGDIRIVQVRSEDSTVVKWAWSKSPWESGKSPIYQPK